ncbi:MAG: DUF2235 domain-containing protein [Pseudomonadota bacterium]
MALYAFDGTWNIDEDDDAKDTNVVRFKELYAGANVDYLTGVGTRFGAIGRVLGGALGVGGRSRIDQMYDDLSENWEDGDRDIDIIGYSRGAALAVHFANKISEEGLKLKDGSVVHPEIRFLGLWDVVGSFGLSFDTLIDFQDINLGWNIDKVAGSVLNCFHAMALDERRETFDLTRLDPENRLPNVKEVWFRGVHGDIGGGNNNPERSNIAFRWMLDCARSCGVPINGAMAKKEKYSKIDLKAPVSESMDPVRDKRRRRSEADEIHPTAKPKSLEVGEAHEFIVLSRLKYNWSGVRLAEGAVYEFQIADTEKWRDKNIKCGPDGWTSEELPWYKEMVVERFEDRRRHKKANWFELIGALGDEDEHLFRIGKGGTDRRYTAERDADLWTFANDLNSKYDNNKGSIRVTILRVR